MCGFVFIKQKFKENFAVHCVPIRLEGLVFAVTRRDTRFIKKQKLKELLVDLIYEILQNFNLVYYT